MISGTIQNLIGIIDKAFRQLDTKIPNQYLEDLAVTIHRVLSSETRHFHTPEHVFSLTDPDAPIRSLAAVFHDLVYYQVDQGFLLVNQHLTLRSRHQKLSLDHLQSLQIG